MPIFRLEGDKLIIAQETNVKRESHLEDWLENSPGAVIQDELVLWIGRQESAPVEDSTIFPDLLGIDAAGNFVIVELKKDQAPREVVAQLLEYAAWANEISDSEIHRFAENYFETRDEFKGKTFSNAFQEVFDILETDELPSLNQKLRLFIVAGEIPTRVARVCRFLRTSHNIDITCIAVSTFQTEAGERLVSMETKVGDEDIAPPPDHPPLREVVQEIVKELTCEKTDIEFTPKAVKKRALEKYPGIKVAAVPFNIRAYTVNQTKIDNIPIEERKYWCLSWGRYRLYDPEKDKSENDENANQVE